MGFGTKWRNWVSILLSTASSSVLLNGAKGRHFYHCKGVRQEDPLSPMLFILALEPLHLLLKKAEQESLISPIQYRSATIRVSLYADDAAIFVNPEQNEVDTVKDILTVFGQTSGLKINLAKSSVFPIRCDGINLDQVLTNLPCQIKVFPGKYLGLPLST